MEHTRGGMRVFARRLGVFFLRTVVAGLALSGGNVPTAWAESVCAEVKIQIDQKLTLERQAFKAVLKIRNGLEGVAVENIRVDIAFKNSSGVAVSASSDPNDEDANFFVLEEPSVGITGRVDGHGTVAALTTGEAHWLIIPGKNSGGGTPQGEMYQVGAKVTYRLAGEEKSVDVIPETITVRPLPLLKLDYFLPGDVYADDPETPNVEEPVVPFTLGVRVTNVGAGSAPQVKIESAQPRIVENEQGLLIGFQIDGSYVDNQPSQPSLLLDFGTIEQGQTRMGRWIMTTTLSGKFYDFSAEYTHADELGGAMTSLLTEGVTGLLTHDVLVDISCAEGEQHSCRDKIRDFLVQTAINASDADTYWVYESDGGITEAVQMFAPNLNGSTLAFNPPSGLMVYARAPIHFDGQGKAVSAVRSDGRAVSSANVWFSKRRNASGTGWLYFLNLFEANPAECGSECRYTLTYDGEPAEASIAGLVYADANGNGVQDAGETGLAGVRVTASGMGTPRAVTSASDGTFSFTDLPAGLYTLTVGALAGHVDGTHAAGTAGGTIGTASIGSIDLVTTTHATGYQFAKVPQATAPEADLAIEALTITPSTPRAGKVFTVTLRTVNSGPASAEARAQLDLPSTLEVVSANPSSGTFDATTGEWAIGSLAVAGTATLEVQVRAANDGQLMIGATVSSTDPATVDPDVANNTASLTVTVLRPSAVGLQVQMKRETRLLVLSHCPPPWSDPDTCTPARVGQLEGMLDTAGIEHVVTSDVDVFRKEFRSGRWNTYWLDAAEQLLGDELVQEMGLAVLRGDSVFLDGLVAPREMMLEWVGVTPGAISRRMVDETVSFLPNTYLQSESLSVSINQFYFQASGQVLATFSGQSPAIVLSNHGNGRVLFFGFDPMSDSTAMASLLPQIEVMLRPRLPSLLTADAYVPVSLQAENLADAVSIVETVTAPSGSQIVKVAPVPATSSASGASWNTLLGSSTVFETGVGIRLPLVNGSHVLTAQVAEEQESAVLADQSLSLAVMGTEELAASVMTLVSAIDPGSISQRDRLIRNVVLGYLQDAINARTDGDLNLSITNVLWADDSLKSMAIDTVAQRTQSAWLLQALHREWYATLSVCMPAETAVSSVSVVKDRGLSFMPKNEGVGFYESQDYSGSSAWRLGAYGINSYQEMQATLHPRKTYQWSLSYSSEGTASLTIFDGPITVGTVSYFSLSGEEGNGSVVGNAVRLQVAAGTGFISFPPSAVPLIEVNATEVNGVPVLHAISTAEGDETELVFYGENLVNGLDVSGTFRADTPVAFGDRSELLVTSGTVSCKAAER